jgi:hypothetical protein
MEALVAAAVLAPMVGAVTAYNAWALYRAWKDRNFPGPRRERRKSDSVECAHHECA